MPHEPLTMSGPRNVNGKTEMARYSSDEIKQWIVGKANFSANELSTRGSNISGAIEKFAGGHGTACKWKAPGDKNSHIIKYHHNTVYHASNGPKGKGTSVSLFYTNPQHKDGKIIGIGGHITSDTYEIEWHAPDWHIGKTFELS
ncbi:hypothetical protein [Oceaniovalibus sp. ACAM 378]|uniref:hypothetical protein n=1 Tax=Oceaniovalibus sp. ACAM 378 TaxID=2599923 RepID=UPI0011D5CF2A|nr:hypothetical protein [Oceaniovalibus sp. ACAM 378]TYB90794.1 hypothetical protein FQ320_03845 [Oceaniovalibus sp. ACAM 378]